LPRDPRPMRRSNPSRIKEASLRLLLVVVLATSWSASTMAGRLVVDSAGRKVEVPDRIERVMAAGPPASALVTILAPEKLVGWNRRPAPEDCLIFRRP
jgi:iron complex transport system substrate-binding protein